MLSRLLGRKKGGASAAAAPTATRATPAPPAKQQPRLKARALKQFEGMSPSIAADALHVQSQDDVIAHVWVNYDYTVGLFASLDGCRMWRRPRSPTKLGIPPPVVFTRALVMSIAGREL